MTLDDVLASGGVEAVFQPLVNFTAGRVGGYEALSRGPQGPLASPRELFSAAIAAGRLQQLERLCWGRALERAAQLDLLASEQTLLFLNAYAADVEDPDLLCWLDQAAADAGVAPTRMVLEVSEAMYIDDFGRFNRRLDRYRARGFRVAVDDVGSGHAGLQTIIELVPDFIKVDRSLIRDIDTDARRRAAVEALVLLASRLDATLIAEGVETPAELAVVHELGIPWGQGYLLGRPMEEPSTAEIEARLEPATAAPPAGPPAVVATELRIGALVERAPAVAGGVEVSAAMELMDRSASDTLVVIEEERPVGLVQRSRLLEMLSRAFGREVHLRRSVELVAERDFLKVDARRSLEEVSRLATARRADTVYDVIAVTREGRYAGVVSVRQLLDAITHCRIEAARHANPLTGLPGNASIESVLRTRLDANVAVGVMHIDLDGFKVYNDTQGFHRGDEAIRFTARLLATAVERLGGRGAFLGHIGGDDFLVVVEVQAVDPLADEIRGQFRRLVPRLYPDADRARGYVLARARNGELQRHRLLDVTVATTVVEPGAVRHYAHVLDTLAEAKRAAKALAHAAAVSPAPRLRPVAG